jgi:hypothetical protein
MVFQTQMMSWKMAFHLMEMVEMTMMMMAMT